MERKQRNFVLETQRLILRPFQAEDAWDVYEYRKDLTVNCFACLRLYSLEEAQAAVKEMAGDEEYTFAIVRKDSGKVIGQIDAHPESSQPDQTKSYVKDTFSPCWMLRSDHQGQGLALEAATAFFDYLFREKSARRIYAYTEDYNLKSQRLCEKLGMRREGLFREFVSFVNDKHGDPVYENTYQYAILKKEWLGETK